MARNANDRAEKNEGAATVPLSPAELAFRKERESANAKANIELEASRKQELAAIEAEKKQQAALAAQAAAEEKKRIEMQAATQKRELAMLDRQQRQRAWEARCKIMPVMSDQDIATCREVWSRPAP